MAANPAAARSQRAALLRRVAEAGPIGFGTSALGNLYQAIDDRQAHATVDAAWQAGIRYYDTAPFYGFGLSERRTGDALRSRPRDEFLLSSKVGRILTPGLAEPGRDGFFSSMPFEASFDYSYDGVMRSYEASLHRLGLARIDILLMHDLGRVTHGIHHERHFTDAVAGGFRALQALRDQGAVDAIGLGVNEIEVCAEALARVDLDVLMIAGRHTLLNQGASGFIEKCRADGVGILAAGAFNSGILATGSGGTAYYDYAPAPREILQRVESIETICSRFDVPLPAAALQFVAGHAGITTLVVGGGKPEEIRHSAAMVRQPVPSAFWQALKEQNLIEYLPTLP